MINLFCDIECIPDQSEGAQERAKAEISAPSNYKDEKKIAAYIEDKAVSAYEKTALDGTYGEICSIAWAVGDGDVYVFTGNSGANEKFLLEQFLYAIQTCLQTNPPGRMLRWIGHNIIGFDLPFLWKRCVINNIKPPFIIPRHARQIGSDHAYDTMREWQGYNGMIRQAALVKALGIDSDQSFGGADVWEAWQKGEYDKICEHNIADVEEVREIYRRMQGVAV